MVSFVSSSVAVTEPLPVMVDCMVMSSGTGDSRALKAVALPCASADAEIITNPSTHHAVNLHPEATTFTCEPRSLNCKTVQLLFLNFALCTLNFELLFHRGTFSSRMA